MLKQLSIFAENKKGTMQQITQILFENDVNILGSVNNDSAEYHPALTAALTLSIDPAGDKISGFFNCTFSELI